MQFKAPRGTSDILPQQQPHWEFVTRAAADVAARFGYRRIDTPLFEDTSLFKRGVGTDTDIVQKEMYSFQDTGGEEVTLRPEGTAPVCRAYLEHGMSSWPQPVRLYYVGPMFRYERPQAGRYRQFHQFGVEVFGDESPEVDAEVIELGWLFLRDLGLTGLKLRLNSIGDAADRPRHLDALRGYYSARLADLPAIDRERLGRSPLRLLDSKEPQSQELAVQAPRSIDYLSDASARRWESVLRAVDRLKAVYPELSYEVDHRLVRGLDYYTHTVFEIEPEGAQGQSTLLGGGRYDGLMEVIGGPRTPGIGFAAGLERFILNLQKQGVGVDAGRAVNVVIVHLGEAAASVALELAAGLRRGGTAALMAPAGKSMKAQMRYADAVESRYALIIGDREIAAGTGQLKDLKAGEGQQVEVKLDAEAVARAVNAA